MTQVTNERKGVVVFGFDYTLFTPAIRGDGVRYSRVENGIKLLQSCTAINHFAVIIAVAGESMRQRLSKLIKKQTGMVEGLDFGLYLIPEEDGKLAVSGPEHFARVVANWVDYCAKQGAKITAGVSSDSGFLDVFSSQQIRTVKCDDEATEVIEFREMTPEEIEQANLAAAPAQSNGGLAAMQAEADRHLIEEDDDSNAEPLPEMVGQPEDKPAVEPEPAVAGERLDKRTRHDPSPDWQSDPIFNGDPAIEQAILFPQYWKELPKEWEFVDVYRVDELFPINLPGASRLYHARKKLMVPGVRTGGKTAFKDVEEAVATLQGWLRDHAPRK